MVRLGSRLGEMGCAQGDGVKLIGTVPVNTLESSCGGEAMVQVIGVLLDCLFSVCDTLVVPAGTNATNVSHADTQSEFSLFIFVSSGSR